MKKLTALILLVVCTFAPIVAAQAAQTPSGIPFAELEQRIDAFVAQYLGETTPGVAVAVVHEGEIIFSRGYGYANFAQRTPLCPATTVFEYASIGKLFTWVSVMQLVERGLLDLDRNVNDYLPASFVAALAFEMPFTMRDLLNHQAGFGEYIFNMISSHNETGSILPLREALLLQRPLQIYVPGTVTAYSNFGTALAGYIVANISGQTFTDFEMENILNPAGMQNTLNLPHFYNNPAFFETMATAHIPDNRGSFAEARLTNASIYPAGALSGTAEDLARFAMALTPPAGESGPLFETVEGLNRIFTPSSLDHTSFPGMHHGFLTYTSAVPAFGHGGTGIGFSTSVVVVPQERFGIVVLANAAGEFNIVSGLLAYLLGNNFDQVAPGVGNMPSTAEVEGTFISARSQRGQFLEFLDFLFTPSIAVTAIGDYEIIVTMAGESARFVQVEPWVYQMVYAETAFINEILNEQIRFRMEDGRPVQIHGATIIGDAIEISQLRSAVNLAVGAAVALVSILFFLIAPIALLVSFLRNRKKSRELSRFRLLRNGMIISGTLLVINSVAPFVRIIIMDMFRTSAEMALHIWLNYVFAILAAVLCVGAMACLAKEKVTLRNKIVYFAAAGLIASLVLVMVNWNFFILL